MEALISSTIGLDRINEAMDELADGRAIRQVIIFGDPASDHPPLTPESENA